MLLGSALSPNPDVALASRKHRRVEASRRRPSIRRPDAGFALAVRSPSHGANVEEPLLREVAAGARLGLSSRPIRANPEKHALVRFKATNASMLALFFEAAGQQTWLARASSTFGMIGGRLLLRVGLPQRRNARERRHAGLRPQQ